jgi:hypothetical protein
LDITSNYCTLSIYAIINLQFFIQFMGKKVKLFLYRPCSPLGLQEVEASTFSDIWLIHGGKVVSLMRWLLFTHEKIPGTHFC